VTDSEFREAFHGHKDHLFRFAYRMTGSRTTSEDVVQECFLALWRRSSAYDSGRGPLRAYLFGIARNLLLKRLRDDRPHEALDADSFICPPIDLLKTERADAVAQAVQALPVLQREAVILFEYEDMSMEEIATATLVDVGAVKSRLYRARANLRRTLAPLLEETKGTLHGTK
jgi:RNA polymerase sigma-70 factor (ECF subfamily)